MSFPNLQYFDYTSSGAPSLWGANGKLATLFDWLLNTKGGWTIPFSSGNSRIYTPVSGNTSLYLADDSTISGSAFAATVRACESASGVGTANLTNAFPTSAQHADAAAVWDKDTSAQSAISRPWAALVSDTWMMIGILVSGNTASPGTTSSSLAVYCYGRPALVDSSDTYGTCIFVSITATQPNAFTGNANPAIAGGQNNLYWDRNNDGTIFSSVGNVMCHGFGNISGAPTFPHPVTGKLYREKVALTDGASTTTTPGSKSMLVRGWIPNLYAPAHNGYNTANIAPFDTFVDTAYNAAAAFLFLASALAAPYLIFETTNTWNPPT